MEKRIVVGIALFMLILMVGAVIGITNQLSYEFLLSFYERHKNCDNPQKQPVFAYASTSWASSSLPDYSNIRGIDAQLRARSKYISDTCARDYRTSFEDCRQRMERTHKIKI